MAGDEQGHELVAELLGGHRRVVLVARGKEHREDVVGSSSPARAALRDLLGDERVDLVPAIEEALERADRVEEPLSLQALLVLRRREKGQRVVAEREERREALAQRVRRGPGSRPKTARRMISRVSA